MHAAITLNAKGLAIADILVHRARVVANSQRFVGKEKMAIIQVKEPTPSCLLDLLFCTPILATV